MTETKRKGSACKKETPLITTNATKVTIAVAV